MRKIDQMFLSLFARFEWSDFARADPDPPPRVVKPEKASSNYLLITTPILNYQHD